MPRPDRRCCLNRVLRSAEAQGRSLQQRLRCLVEIARRQRFSFEKTAIGKVEGQAMAEDQGVAIGHLAAGLAP